MLQHTLHESNRPVDNCVLDDLGEGVVGDGGVIIEAVSITQWNVFLLKSFNT